MELILTGVTVKLNTDGTSNLGSGFFIGATKYVAIRGGTVQGQNPSTGTAQAAQTTDEQKSGASIRYGSDHIEFDHVTFLDLQGFGMLISSDDGIGGPLWPKDIWIHHTIIEGGEMGFGVVSVRNFLSEDNQILDTTWSAYDFEPDFSTEGYENVLVQRDTIDRFGWEAFIGAHTHWLLAMNPADSALGASMKNLTFRNNHVIRGHVIGAGGNSAGGGLLIRSTKSNVKDIVVITGNISDDARTVGGNPMPFNAARNLTITDNVQRTLAGVPLYVHSPDGTNVPDVNIVVTPNTVN